MVHQGNVQPLSLFCCLLPPAFCLLSHRHCLPYISPPAPLCHTTPSPPAPPATPHHHTTVLQYSAMTPTAAAHTITTAAAASPHSTTITSSHSSTTSPPPLEGHRDFPGARHFLLPLACPRLRKVLRSEGGGGGGGNGLRSRSRSVYNGGEGVGEESVNKDPIS